MSESDFDQDDQMIKYLREKITGRPAVFSRVGDLPTDDTISSIKKSDSQNSLTDLSLTDQVEKTTNTSGSRRLITSSSPIIIPKKAPRSNASSQSSSSYTSIADQIPSVAELDDVSNGVYPTLAFTCQRLEHSAARDRISVKNKRRQPIKQKLSTLRETDDDLFALNIEDFDDDNPPPLPPKQRYLRQQSFPLSSNSTTKSKKNILLSSTPDDEPVARIEAKPPQPLIDRSDLDTARARLRMSVRPRDRSADNILLSINTNSQSSTIISKPINSMQRSMSFKHSHDVPKTDLFNQMNIQSIKREEPSSSSSPNSISRSSSQEHIYDNLDVFKRPKTNENESNSSVKTRESTRLRPVTMHPFTANDKQMINEFENVFNQLKRRGSIRTSEEKQIEVEPIVNVPSPQPANRRKTVTSVHLSSTNKIATDESQPTPSWIDIAKQKQSKFQTISNESEPMIITRKQTPTTDSRLNRKSMFESSNSPAIERDSIRALKAGNPNRINNLIQFFDK